MVWAMVTVQGKDRGQAKAMDRVPDPNNLKDIRQALNMPRVRATRKALLIIGMPQVMDNSRIMDRATAMGMGIHMGMDKVMDRRQATGKVQAMVKVQILGKARIMEAIPAIGKIKHGKIKVGNKALVEAHVGQLLAKVDMGRARAMSKIQAIGKAQATDSI